MTEETYRTTCGIAAKIKESQEAIDNYDILMQALASMDRGCEAQVMVTSNFGPKRYYPVDASALGKFLAGENAYYRKRIDDLKAEIAKL